MGVTVTQHNPYIQTVMIDDDILRLRKQRGVNLKVSEGLSMETSLVSVITPCFNGAEHIHRLLESIIDQDYKKIEMILINDGSTDKTEEILFSYSERMKACGIEFEYHYQENSGQAAALNLGLKHFRGEYVTCVDADDFLPCNSISKRVAFLEQYPQYGLVRSDAQVVSENDIERVIRRMNRFDTRKSDENLFDRMLLEQNVYAVNGAFLIRSAALLDAIPDRMIYCSRAGQNWQLFLPILYKYKCGYIDEPLFTVVSRASSHSRSINMNVMGCVFDRFSALEDILRNTITRIPLDHNKYDVLISEKYARFRMETAIEHGEYAVASVNYQALKDKHAVRLTDLMIYLTRSWRGGRKAVVGLRKFLWAAGFYNI